MPALFLFIIKMIKPILSFVVAITFALSAPAVYSKPNRKPPNVRRVSINLTVDGYRPESFRLKRGIRAKLTFTRKTDATCGQIIVIPAYGIQRDLPLNRRVTISFTPRKNGTFKFTCGMDMLRGRIIVN